MSHFWETLKNSPHFYEVLFVIAIVLLILAHKISVEGMVGVS